MSNKRLREKFYDERGFCFSRIKALRFLLSKHVWFGLKSKEINYDGIDEDVWDAIEYLVYEFDYKVVDPQSDIMI